MRIYITKVFKPLKDVSKPIICKNGFGSDLRMPYHYSFIELAGIIHEFYEKVFSTSLYASLYKEVKFTITIKF